MVPGEPQGFGDGEALLRLLAEADGWSCVEVDDGLADEIREEFADRWGLARTSIDVIHERNEPAAVHEAGSGVDLAVWRTAGGCGCVGGGCDCAEVIRDEVHAGVLRVQVAHLAVSANLGDSDVRVNRPNPEVHV